MRSILVALLLCLAALSGCFGDIFSDDNESTAEICTGEEDEDGNLAESCDIEPNVPTIPDNSTILLTIQIIPLTMSLTILQAITLNPWITALQKDNRFH